MGTVRVVVLSVLAEHGFEVAPSEDEHPVQALASDGAQKSLGDGVRPRRPDRGLDDPDALSGEDGGEGSGELGVSVTDHAPKAVMTLCTIGHGTLPSEVFASLLDTAEVGRVVDVRSFPGSRRNPQFGREEMERWAPEAGLAYVWIRDLGGRRRPISASKHVALRNDAFRAYADYMETDLFLGAVEDLLTLTKSESSAIMCSESVWWRCHRRLLADHLVLVRGVDVIHLMHDGRVTRHALTAGVRLVDDTLVYDVGMTPSFPVR